MSAKRQSHSLWYGGWVALVALILVGILLILQPPTLLAVGVARACAIIGYLAVFMACVSAAYLRELVRFFGRPFIKIHHIVSVAGLALFIIHPVSVAIYYATPSVFLPKLDSLTSFFQWGGPPALYLLIIAALGALWRKKLASWRTIHALNYLAFLLGTIHAISLGTDTHYVVVRIVAILMVLGLAALLVRKRLKKPAAKRA